MFSVGLTVMCMAALMGAFMGSKYAFARVFTYSSLHMTDRVAIDKLTREIRQANCVTAYTTNSLTLLDADGAAITYTYSPAAKTLTRAKSGSSTVLLTRCASLNFDLGQRNAVGGSYDVYPAATPANAKVVDISWRCAATIGKTTCSESVQTARIVIRKQGN
jgi:hypothetical protein